MIFSIIPIILASLLNMGGSVDKSVDQLANNDWIYNVPMSNCFDWNNWAWYDVGYARMAKCNTYPNINGDVFTIEAWSKTDQYGQKLIDVQFKNPNAANTNVYGMNCPRPSDWVDETRVRSSQCLGDKFFRGAPEMRRFLEAAHGLRFEISGSGYTMEPDMNRGGADIIQFPNVTYEDCVVKCDANGDCAAITFRPEGSLGFCWLKRTGTIPYPYNGLFSGSKQR